MKRLHISISEEQDRRLARIAAEREIPKAELIRQILDRTLEPGNAEAAARAVIEETAGLRADCSDGPKRALAHRDRGWHAQRRARADGQRWAGERTVTERQDRDTEPAPPVRRPEIVAKKDGWPAASGSMSWVPVNVSLPGWRVSVHQPSL